MKNDKTCTFRDRVSWRLYPISADRSLFGRLLVAAKSREINLRDVLTYELSSIPFSLAHADGTLRKTTKSVLMSEIEKVESPVGCLPPIDPHSVAYIIDGMALV